MYLVIRRQDGQEIHIGNDIRIVLTECRNGACKVLIDAPKEVHVSRPDAIRKEPKPCE
jgi:sRNA-binding carbon storage regulator CsrA